MIKNTPGRSLGMLLLTIILAACGPASALEGQQTNSHIVPKVVVPGDYMGINVRADNGCGYFYDDSIVIHHGESNSDGLCVNQVSSTNLCNGGGPDVLIGGKKVYIEENPNLTDPYMRGNNLGCPGIPPENAFICVEGNIVMAFDQDKDGEIDPPEIINHIIRDGKELSINKVGNKICVFAGKAEVHSGNLECR